MKFEDITPAIIGKRVETTTGCAMGFNRTGTITAIEHEQYSNTMTVQLDEPVYNGYDRYDSLNLFVRKDNKLGSALGWNIINK